MICVYDPCCTRLEYGWQMVQSDKYGDTLTYVDDAFLVELEQPAYVAIDGEAALVADVAQEGFVAVQDH